MPLVYDTLQENYLGYAAVFACVGAGFMHLRMIVRKESGPGYWALGFLANSLGFVFWSGAVPLGQRGHFAVGELLHATGFVLLAAGAYRFSGHEYKKRDAALLAALALGWVAALAIFPRHGAAAALALKALRSAVFLSAGATLLLEKKSGRAIGVEIAGASLLLWGGFIILFAFLRINAHVYLGLLAGLQILSAFGMVAMAMDRIRLRAESSERQVKTLEGILPICSYCKKIRDGDNSWQLLEVYIEDRSKAEFSHGICPECFEKHRPDR